VCAPRTDTGRVLQSARPIVGHVAQACSVLWLGRGRPSAHCAHGPSSVSAQELFKKLKIPFSFFIRFQGEFKLQKIVSKYPELQKL
jgi:hypothetical protein